MIFKEMGKWSVSCWRCKRILRRKSFFVFLRGIYYKLLSTITEHDLISQFTGFGLFDRTVIEEFRKINDLYPYSRGLISDLGFKVKVVKYRQRKRVWLNKE